MRRFLGSFRKFDPSESELGPLDRLSARQRELLALMASDVFTSKELARKTALTPSTIDNQLSKAAKVLGVSNRREAARRYAVLMREAVADQQEPRVTESRPGAFELFIDFMRGPPLGGRPSRLTWDQVTLQVFRVAFIGLISMTAIVLFILAILKTFP